MTTPVHTIKALCERSDAIARDKGWIKDTDARPYYTSLILQVSELSEALEDYRNHKGLNEVYYEVKKENGGIVLTEVVSTLKEGASGKPCGIPIELADFVIRICQRAGTDKEGEKLDDAYNARAPYEDKIGFEEMLGEATLSAALAYDATKKRSGEYIDFLADALHTVFGWCAENNIDLWAAIDEKEAYNRTRPHRHGNKRV